MELWSIRNPSELAVLYDQGSLITDSEMIDPDYVPAYDWMAAELDRLVKIPRQECRYPVWAWKCWDYERSCKPDLRVRWGNKNEELVLLKIEIPDHLVLLSEFHLWHYALNRWYLPIDEEGQMNFDRIVGQGNTNEWPFQEPYYSLVIHSWRRMFSWEKLDPKFHGALGSSIQAVFWEIKREWVIEARHFRSK